MLQCLIQGCDNEKRLLIGAVMENGVRQHLRTEK